MGNILRKTGVGLAHHHGIFIKFVCRFQIAYCPKRNYFRSNGLRSSLVAQPALGRPNLRSQAEGRWAWRRPQVLPSGSRPARVISVVRVHIIHARLRVMRQKRRHCQAIRDPAIGAR